MLADEKTSVKCLWGFFLLLKNFSSFVSIKLGSSQTKMIE